jgi:dipeptidyl aminopeptidase/acylaminoacyl peptidase
MRLPSSVLMALLIGAVLFPNSTVAQEKPKFVIEEDCSHFSVAPDNKIVFVVQRQKRMKKIVIQRDDIWVASPNGGKRRIVEGEKFMPAPPPLSFQVDSISWSPDSRLLAADITFQKPATDDESSPTTTKGIALFDENGSEIKVTGSKTRFIEDAGNATWLADGQTIVYVTGGGPFQIIRMKPSQGKAVTLFEGHTFDGITWDAKHNQAYAIGRNLSISGRDVLVQLDLLNEGVRELTRVPEFQGKLTIAPSGNRVGYFVDADTIEVRELAHPNQPLKTRAGFGRFQFGLDEKRVLLKRGPDEKSGTLVWVGLTDGTFRPILHDQLVSAFQIAPDGQSIIIAEPGKHVLKGYSLQ